MDACSISGCESEVRSRGLCGKHYQRWRKHGDPLAVGVAAPPVVSVGERYGRLVVIDTAGSNRHGQRRYLVRCDCGTEKTVNGYSLTQGHSQSCGCLHRERFRHETHGRSGTAEHGIWKNIIQRCTNPKNPSYPFYGGRGVKICERWRASFEAFLADMGPRPGADYGIDREDPAGDYTPENCRWLTDSENSRRAHLGKPHVGGNYHQR
jgi:hypothetical protein